ncbi:hypothetical protein BOX15_Mlig029612g1 [Macrostomum lignano]|uniref:Uncharacterized protein n=1 Tax=Macrostomum lignano TaxID=282301 RepID=A0A267EWI7_9PLAT|nr:hypothetical protein BOX15_Mlig029612g1 [Macrostomum lignano]
MLPNIIARIFSQLISQNEHKLSEQLYRSPIIRQAARVTAQVLLKLRKSIMSDGSGRSLADRMTEEFRSGVQEGRQAAKRRRP